jgi:hypothetical protein
VIEGCEALNVKYLAAKTFGKIIDTRVELVSI